MTITTRDSYQRHQPYLEPLPIITGNACALDLIRARNLDGCRDWIPYLHYSQHGKRSEVAQNLAPSPELPQGRRRVLFHQASIGERLKKCPAATAPVC